MSILKSTHSGIYSELTTEVLKIKGYKQRGDDIFSIEFVNPEFPDFIVKLWPGNKPSFFTFSDPYTDEGKDIFDVEQLERYESIFRKNEYFK